MKLKPTESIQIIQEKTQPAKLSKQHKQLIDIVISTSTNIEHFILDRCLYDIDLTSSRDTNHADQITSVLTLNVGMPYSR